MRLDLPRCDYSDLERISCACPNCESFTMTNTEQALRSGVVHIADLKPATQTLYRARTKPEPQPWQFGARHYPAGDTTATPGIDPIIIDCDHPHDTGICDTCWQDLQICLGDIPSLVQDLNAAIAKDVQFVAHGHRNGDDTPMDEEPVMIHMGASSALQQLADALRAPAPDNGWTVGQAVVARSRSMLADTDLRISDRIGDQAATISRAVVRAHKVIDRPPDWWFYGSCPGCGDDILDERGLEYVTCLCGYAASLSDHHAAMIDQRENEKLTVDELVGVFTRAGETVGRRRINYFVEEHGLPRDRANRPRWVKDRWGNVRLTSSEVWVYRIGDVRDLLVQLDRSEAG